MTIMSYVALYAPNVLRHDSDRNPFQWTVSCEFRFRVTYQLAPHATLCTIAHKLRGMLAVIFALSAVFSDKSLNFPKARGTMCRRTYAVVVGAFPRNHEFLQWAGPVQVTRAKYDVHLTKWGVRRPTLFFDSHHFLVLQLKYGFITGDVN